MSSVLYRSEDSLVFLLDIPTSIAEAQAWNADEEKQLLSSEPLVHPFKATEPKSERARQSVLSGEIQDDLHRAHASSITAALLSIIDNHVGDWCLPRRTMPSVFSGKRSALTAGLDDSVGSPQAGSTNADGVGGETLEKIMKSLSGREHDSFGMGGSLPLHITYRATGEDSNSDTNILTCLTEDSELSLGVIIQNPGDQVVQATLSVAPDRYFWVPPTSMAILAKCDDSGPLREALRKGLPSSAVSSGHDRKFDMILLDPPWPNRSARRKSSYETQYSARTAKNLLYGMDLDIHLAVNGYVAVWITNKASVRDIVLGYDGRGSGGWFGSLGVELIEEWLWVKTTVHGEPIYDPNGVWRKPYEVLLLARQSNSMLDVVANSQPAEVKRRVIAAVPDLHSRKPCLNALFGELLFAGREYRALEVFARYMVAGWCSWGDEALKYNCEAYWYRKTEQELTEILGRTPQSRNPGVNSGY